MSASFLLVLFVSGSSGIYVSVSDLSRSLLIQLAYVHLSFVVLGTRSDEVYFVLAGAVSKHHRAAKRRVIITIYYVPYECR